MTELANDLKMMLNIYHHDQAGTPIWFSKLAEELNIPRVEISKLDDKLSDLGLIDREYMLVDGKWTYCYHIADEAVHLMEQVDKSQTSIENDTGEK